MPRHESIILEIDELTKYDKTNWEKKLTRSYNDCGCSLGAAFLMCSLILFAINFTIFPSWAFLSMLEYALIAIFVSIVMSFSGKLIGIKIGHFRFQKYSKLLISRICLEKSHQSNLTFDNPAKENS